MRFAVKSIDGIYDHPFSKNRAVGEIVLSFDCTTEEAIQLRESCMSDPDVELRLTAKQGAVTSDELKHKLDLENLGVAVLEHVINSETGEKSVRLVDPSRVRFNHTTGCYEVDGISLNAMTKEGRRL